MAAVSLSQFPSSSYSSSFPTTNPRRTISPRSISSRIIKPTPGIPILIKHTITNRRNNRFTIAKATSEEDPRLPDTTTTAKPVAAESESKTSSPQNPPANDELSELGEEIKKAMQEREKKGEKDLWSGVAEEIGKIEWPAFRKVLGTTGVVMGVIAGSSVVLLTVNAVLTELSDKVFAGRGVQDFFS